MSSNICLNLNFKDRNIDDKEFIEKQSHHLTFWAESNNLKIDEVKIRQGSIIMGIQLSPEAIDALIVTGGGIAVFAFKAIAQDILVQYWRKITNNEDEYNGELDMEEVKKISNDIAENSALTVIKANDFNGVSLPFSLRDMGEFENPPVSGLLSPLNYLKLSGANKVNNGLFHRTKRGNTQETIATC